MTNPKEKQREWSRRYRERHKEEIAARRRRYAQENREAIRVRRRRYYVENRDRILARFRRWSAANPGLQKSRIKRWRLKTYAALKREVFAAYGGGVVRCTRCPFDDIRALCLDHINGGGRRERERYRHSGGIHGLYRALKAARFPAGYQVLCANCNLIKEWETRGWGTLVSSLAPSGSGDR